MTVPTVPAATGALAATSAAASSAEADRLYAAAEADFARWEIVRDVMDECMDIALDDRQSGHPGGSRSKAHMLLALMLSGAMRWDIRRPWLPFADRFVLSAGHTVPVVYAALAVLNDALQARRELDGGRRGRVPALIPPATRPRRLLCRRPQHLPRRAARRRGLLDPAG